VATIEVVYNPEDVAINPAGTFAYTAHSFFGTIPGALYKIDLATDTVVATIEIGKDSILRHLAIDPAGTFAYITHSLYSANSVYSDAVLKIDLATDTVVATIEVGKGWWPDAVAINPAGTFAYITNLTRNAVFKIDLATDKVVATIVVGRYSWLEDVAINPAGTFAYITNSNENKVHKIRLVSAVPVFTATMSVSAKTVAIYAKLTVPAGAAISLRVAPLSAQFCKVSGTTLKFLKAGACNVTVTVRPKIGKSNSKTVTLTVK
jgi:YVTN family beta-propeller protein